MVSKEDFIETIKPNKRNLFWFFLMFFGVNILVFVIVAFFVAPSLDTFGPKSIGLPFPFYIYDCGFHDVKTMCEKKVIFSNLVLSVLFWYILAVLINRIRKQK